MIINGHNYATYSLLLLALTDFLKIYKRNTLSYVLSYIVHVLIKKEI